MMPQLPLAGLVLLALFGVGVGAVALSLALMASALLGVGVALLFGGALLGPAMGVLVVGGAAFAGGVGLAAVGALAFTYPEVRALLEALRLFLRLAAPLLPRLPEVARQLLAAGDGVACAGSYLTGHVAPQLAGAAGHLNGLTAPALPKLDFAWQPLFMRPFDAEHPDADRTPGWIEKVGGWPDLHVPVLTSAPDPNAANPLAGIEAAIHAAGGQVAAAGTVVDEVGKRLKETGALLRAISEVVLTAHGDPVPPPQACPEPPFPPQP
jgi:hypothetical protein